MTSRSSHPRRRPPKKSQSQALWDEMLEGPGRKLLAIVAMLTAGAYLFGFFKPVIDSGPLPVPARTEVTELAKSVDEKFKSTKEGLDQTLEVAKAANLAAQNANDQLATAKLDRLIAQKIQLEALISMNPQDQTLKQALEHTQIDIGKLSSVTKPQTGVALEPK